MRTFDHSGRVLSRILMAAVIVGPITAATTLAGPSAVQSDELATLVNAALGLRASYVENLIIDETPGQPLIGFVSIEGTLQVLHLEPYSVRSDNYQLLVQGADGQIRAHAPGPVRTLRGSLLGVAGSVVVGSMLDDGLHARIVLQGGDEYWLEPIHGRIAEAADGAYVVYRTEDVLPTNRTCALDAIQQPFRADAPLAEAGSVDDGDPLAAGGLCVAELACDADFEYFQAYGSVAAVEAQINSVINTLNVQYERDVGLTHSLGTIIVRSTSNDPYKGNGANKLLTSFRAEWETNLAGIQRDVAQLFTGRDLGGSTIGIAWLSSVCTSYQYSVVQSDYSGNFACVTDLSAHELGHSWGAGHCSCSNYTMNAFITCANRFHPTETIPEIVAFAESRTCVDGCGGDPPVCGDGVCEGSEDQFNCPGDCGDPPTNETDCSDGIDNDGDGFIDCADDDCAGDPACAPGGDSAIVDCITYKTQGGPAGLKHLKITVTIVDDTGAPVDGASVLMTLHGNNSYNFGGSTNAEGEVTFTLLMAGNICYTSDVTNVTATGLSFNGVEPANGFLKGSDSTPDADCRNSNDGCGSG
ncbi:MAG: hypothetical protein IIB53_12285 [Planctomycetes bacterium]|nr:hypothetical protein [Planctomycetota bacterium]